MAVFTRIKRLLKLIKRGPFYETIVIFTNAIELDPSLQDPNGSSGKTRDSKKEKNENEVNV